MGGASGSTRTTSTAIWRRARCVAGAAVDVMTHKKSKTGTNIVVRGEMYYFRKTIKGKPYMVSTEIRIGGKREKDLAEARARQIETEINEGRFGFVEKAPKATVTLGAWCDKHVPAQQSQVAESTYANVANAALKLRETVVNGETWEEKNIASISETDCKALLTVLQFGVLRSSNSRRTFQSIAGSIFEAAMTDGFLEKNPWRFRRPAFQPRTRVVTRDEQERVFPLLSSYNQRLMVMEVSAGLRVECELLSLKIEDIDFTRRQVFVRKGKGSKQRFVPLSTDAAQALREQLAANATGNPGAEKVSPRIRRRLKEGYVFPMSPRMALVAWHYAADQTGVERFTSHDLRRTFGTRCAEAGVPMKTLQLWMGHSDIRITAEFYV